VSAPVVGVLALQGDVREHLGALSAAGATPVRVRRPEELADLDGIVLPGGESTTMGKLAVAFGVLEPLRALVAAGQPAYGSCAGMILLADSILDGLPEQPRIGGIDMVVRRNAFGRQVDSFEAPLSMPALDGGPLHAVFIRAPWVEKVGDDVDVLGRMPAEGLHRIGRRAAGAHGEHALADASDPAEVIGRIVAVRQGHLLATAFHPELTGDARVHRLFVDIVRERS
jgi:pyridoxal 5'-phosphate synthase pdxT subunit